MLHIESNKEIKSIEVSDLSGRMVLNQPVINNQVDLGNLAAGIYGIKIYNAANTVVGTKIIVKR
ncbi:MAG: T9SS type A sorting domain-containing protein [Bacteroidales bacterium]|nr:T9SS type A sorting domain-containing protein [Bacteroidales bacterium]